MVSLVCTNLKLNLVKKTSYVTKVDMGPRDRLMAAAIIDYALEYYYKVV